MTNFGQEGFKVTIFRKEQNLASTTIPVASKPYSSTLFCSKVAAAEAEESFCLLLRSSRTPYPSPTHNKNLRTNWEPTAEPYKQQTFWLPCAQNWISVAFTNAGIIMGPYSKRDIKNKQKNTQFLNSFTCIVSIRPWAHMMCRYFLVPMRGQAFL